MGETKIHIDKFYKDSFILTLSNMVTGMIAFVFSIILSRELGAEGLGLYGLIMPVYGLLLCFTSDGLITAVSKISTLYFNRKEFRNLNRTLSTVFLFVSVWASCVAFLVLICHHLVAVHIVRDVRASEAIMVLSPALVFIPLSAVIKGYFYGLGQYKVTASVDILEKLLRVLILLGTVSVITVRTVGRTVAIAYFALAVGERVSFLMLFLCYKIQKKKITGNQGRSKSRIQLMFDIFVISVPLCVNGIFSSILSTVSTLIVPRRLVSAGFTYSEALALIGRFGGMALNISTLPFIIIGSMLTVLVPELSLMINRKDYWSAEERIAQVLKLAGIVGVSTALVCTIVPESLGFLFYQRRDLGDMIRFSAPICLITFISSPTFGILNALGKQNVLLKNSLINSFQSLLLIVLFVGIPNLNIYGYGLSIMLTSLTSLFLNVREIKKVCEIKIGLADIIILILAGLAAYLFAALVGSVLHSAPLLLRTSAIVVTCFAGVIGISRFAAGYWEEA